MIIRMREKMSGSRHDDRPWPLPGYNFEVPDWEGEALIRSKLAQQVTMPSEPEVLRVPVPEPEVLPDPEPEAAPAPEPVAPRAQELREMRQEQAPEPPKPADPKQSWVEYAMSHGVSEDDANMMTKAELQSRYGGRL